ncbi:hypothetical protein PMZ80_003331 [Knufia obscura]|uniref:Uncharacterized protein n=2 Tax=Knufia TaxID=430999 RepID=A0AAN8IA85_9EURO|nr:hypothetical protein PMZ80_003331 [Knufia obscura]KAK5956406.1 hypothetical protein OHC33_002983 [Knufia fluminis]
MSPSISFAAETTTSQRRSSIYNTPQKKQKMSITQTYFLAHSARGKLSREAARADHDLRLLVGHANMLDSLMITIAGAEQEQERWFNRSLSGAREEEEEIRHEDTIVEEPEADWEAEDAESSDESDYEEEQFKPADPVETSSMEIDMEFDDEEDQSLVLTRTASRHSPPELTLDDDSDSEDDHMPPSPPNLSVDNLTSKQTSQISTGALFPSEKGASPSQSLESNGFYLPARQQPTIIAAY